ncbi:MAG: BCCT family transporter, partial [Clostridiales bacterium]
MKNEIATAKKWNIDKVSIAISIMLLAALVFFTVFNPNKTTETLVTAKDFVTNYLGFYFIILIIAILAYNCWLVFSKYGNIRLGKEAPKYKTFGWFAMIFFASMGATILFWSSVEWMYYVQTPPFGLKPLSADSYEISLAYSFFHWGIAPWSIYAFGVIPLAYRYYVRGKDGLALHNACEGVWGDKNNPTLARIITIIFIFGIVGGLTLSYGAVVPMLTNNLHYLFGTPETFFVEVLFVLGLTALFTWSASSGLSRGILNLSRICAFLSFVLVFIF